MKRFLLFVVLVVISSAAYSSTPVQAQTSDAARTLQLINQARANAGLAPLAVNLQLTSSAQAHADDMQRSGTGIGHAGSDGSTPTSRIVRGGYGSYSWGPFVGENWAAYQTVDQSFNWWMSDAAHRNNILRVGFREVGVGVSYTASGYPILVTDFGAQPNVLPVFMSGTGPAVTLVLSNENAAPAGDGPKVIGTATQVDIATGADFSNARTYPYSQTLAFSSADGQPITSVYVRFHDSQGRTAVSTASSGGQVIRPAAVTVQTATTKPSPTRTRTPRPTATRTPRPSPTATASLTATATATPTDTPTFTPSPTNTATRTRTPLPPTPTVATLVQDLAGIETATNLGYVFAAGGVLSALAAAFIALRSRRKRE